MRYHPRVLALWAMWAAVVLGLLYGGEVQAAAVIGIAGYPVLRLITFETAPCRACDGAGRIREIGFLGIKGGDNWTSCYSCGGAGRRVRRVSMALRRKLGIDRGDD